MVNLLIHITVLVLLQRTSIVISAALHTLVSLCILILSVVDPIQLFTTTSVKTQSFTLTLSFVNKNTYFFSQNVRINVLDYTDTTLVKQNQNLNV